MSDFLEDQRTQDLIEGARDVVEWLNGINPENSITRVDQNELYNGMPGGGGINTNEKSFFRVNPNMVLGATPQEFGYGMGYTPGGEADMATATERGTKAANETLEDNTSETNRLLRQLLAKNWSVNLFPTSGLGLLNRNAAEAADAVTGG